MPTPRLALTRTYLAPAGVAAAPGGGELPGVADVGAAREASTEETYYDTADLALAAAGAHVRRQTGDGPRGWVLELPGRGPRTHEVRHALGRAVRTAPAALQRLTWAAARGRNVGPVLALQASAAQRDLVDADGQVVARLTTREVTARALSPEDSTPQTWVEWQAEVVDGRRDLLDAVSEAWEEAGAVESDRSAQLRAVLDGPDEGGDGDEGEPAGGSAGDVVLGQLARDVSRLLAQDPLARIDAPDAARSLTVALRSLDAVLAVYGPLFEAERRDALRAELAWLGGVSGAVRESELVTDRVLDDVEEEAAGYAAGTGTGDPAGVAERLRVHLADRHSAATDALLDALDSDRYRALVAELESFVAVPPVTKDARRSARKTLLPLVAESHRAVKSAFRDVDLDGAELAEPVAEAERELRTAAATARYAATPLTALRGDAVEDYVDALRDVQELLVEHALTELARDRYAELVAEAGEGAFVLGRLHALEEVRAAVALHDLDDVFAVANKKKLRKWMD